ncbi:AraC family transcriptional regulator [Pelagibacterium sp. H642]|uniref:AraC family transcriptional regulator n=1 Tax=Pelagibacterium sp. H642 TaxID=1881069 RepID=UPI00281549BF|nr:AraC family transcriptional regulator [Pelagibacterium sp. H642]WMT92743.1 AraC family transcriptional regulator [Pelagibacterium sp. H642]
MRLGPANAATEIAEHVATLAPGERIVLPAGSDGDPTILLCGSYSFGADGSNSLLHGLRDLLHIPAGPIGSGPLAAAVQLLGGEADRTEPGSALVIDRLVGLLFVYALRAWLSQHGDAGNHSWFGALQNPAVGPAVQAVHDNPAYAWTVEALAQRSGLSRAAFARRFNQAVGEPPLAYVTRWRMTVAASLLESGERIGEVASKVGYDNEFAFAKAFKRVRGVSPGAHRRRYER